MRDALFLACGLIAFSAFSACFDARADSIPPLDVSQSEHSADVSYVSGGIGFAEREYLDSIRQDFNLKIEAALSSGEYIADVTADILQGSQLMLETVLNGPQLLVKLPAGRYLVRLRYGDQTKEQTITVSDKAPAQMMFVFTDVEKPRGTPTTLPPMKF